MDLLNRLDHIQETISKIVIIIEEMTLEVVVEEEEILY